MLYFRLKFLGALPEVPKECQSWSLLCATRISRQGKLIVKDVNYPALQRLRPMRKWSDVSFSIVQQDSPMPFGLGDIDTRRVIMTTSLVALWEMPCEITRLSSEGLR